jgi:hypothetical protein
LDVGVGVVDVDWLPSTELEGMVTLTVPPLLVFVGVLDDEPSLPVELINVPVNVWPSLEIDVTL